MLLLVITEARDVEHLRHGVVIENTYGSIVSGNMIEERTTAAIVLDSDCCGTTLAANVIAHTGQGNDLRDAHGCAVSAPPCEEIVDRG